MESDDTLATRELNFVDLSPSQAEFRSRAQPKALGGLLLQHCVACLDLLQQLLLATCGDAVRWHERLELNNIDHVQLLSEPTLRLQHR